VSDLSREFELTTRIINKWKQAACPSHPQVRSVVQGAEGDMDEAQELRMLRKKVAELEVVNDILKKAAIILGTSTLNKLGK
jgi:transposase